MMDSCLGLTNCPHTLCAIRSDEARLGNSQSFSLSFVWLRQIESWHGHGSDDSTVAVPVPSISDREEIQRHEASWAWPKLAGLSTYRGKDKVVLFVDFSQDSVYIFCNSVYGLEFTMNLNQHKLKTQMKFNNDPKQSWKMIGFFFMRNATQILSGCNRIHINPHVLNRLKWNLN